MISKDSFFRKNLSVFTPKFSFYFIFLSVLLTLGACNERAKHRIAKIHFESPSSEIDTEYTYDEKDHLVKVTSGISQVEFVYNNEGRIRKKIVSEADETKQTTRFEWKEGLLLSSSEELDLKKQRTFSYGEKGEITEVAIKYSRLGSTIRDLWFYNYKKDSKEITSIERRFNFTVLTVDAVNISKYSMDFTKEGLLQRIMLDKEDEFATKTSEQTKYFYDEDKRLIEVSNSVHQWLIEYDDLNRVHRLKDKSNKLEYTYTYADGEVKDLYMEILGLEFSFLFDLNGKFHQSTDLRSVFWYELRNLSVL